jgi:branched-chain amino acid aminotransferase
MFSMLWSPASGWHQPEFGRLQNLSIHPGMLGLHYGQVAFEGLKAHRRVDGSMVVFRPHEHARRFQTSTRRLAMPELPTDIFLDAVDRLVAADHVWLSDDPAHSLYLRPIMFGTDESLMLRPSKNYRFLLMAFVAGGFFGDRVDTVSVLISRDYCRAAPGGTGNVKVAGNYAATFVAQQQAQEAGCHQVVWLDAVERRWVEEMGGMNLFFVRNTGTVMRSSRLNSPARYSRELPATRCWSWPSGWAAEPAKNGSRWNSGGKSAPRAGSPRCSPAARPLW